MCICTYMTSPHQIVFNTALIIIGFIPNLNFGMWRPVRQSGSRAQFVKLSANFLSSRFRLQTIPHSAKKFKLTDSLPALRLIPLSSTAVFSKFNGSKQIFCKIKYVNQVGKQAHTIKRANLVLYCHIAMKTISQYGFNQITPLSASSAAYKVAIGEKFFKREDSLLFSEQKWGSVTPNSLRLTMMK